METTFSCDKKNKCDSLFLGTIFVPIFAKYFLFFHFFSIKKNLYYFMIELGQTIKP